MPFLLPIFLCIEGIPVIIRFKTDILILKALQFLSIEGIPVIIRFKTLTSIKSRVNFLRIEGIPVIIRFKTEKIQTKLNFQRKVLKVFQL